ncbi:MAG: Nif3-like dinuclear metal center hexameric protein [Leptospiraceae bacterium]|nr:Nif3-like dinuclear metal center hexameric protein [Leptospiraceae bacterium]
MLLAEFQEIMQALVPAELAEDYDNTGLLVGNPTDQISGILIALDVSMAVQEEALEQGCNLIVSHHPIWFKARQNLTGSDFVARQIQFAIKNDLNLFASHTNLDNLANGVNRAIVNLLNLRHTVFLEPLGSNDSHQTPAGTGMLGELPATLSSPDFLALLQSTFGCQCIRYRSGPATIYKVAVCGGAGGFLLEKAIAAGADALVTGDVGYHRFWDADHQILLADLGHYESERFTVDVLRNLIAGHCPRIPIRIAQKSENPVQYYCP